MNLNIDFQEVVRDSIEESFLYVRSLEPEEDCVLITNEVIDSVQRWMNLNNIVFYKKDN